MLDGNIVYLESQLLTENHPITFSISLLARDLVDYSIFAYAPTFYKSLWHTSKSLDWAIRLLQDLPRNPYTCQVRPVHKV